MKPKLLITACVSLTILLFFAFTWIFFLNATQQNPLPVYGTVPAFQLIDSRGKEFGLQNLNGKAWVADFIFTTCGSICPVMTKNMTSLYRSYKIDGRVEFVSVSVNPENDSPQVLTEYAKQYGADVSRWHFLTGSREAITKLAVEGFKIGSGEEPIFHSGKFVLVDKNGRIRGFYDGTVAKEIRTLFKDLARLLRELER